MKLKARARTINAVSTTVAALATLLPQTGLAKNFKESFPIGAGSTFSLTLKPELSVDVTVSIAESTFGKLSVEYYMDSPGSLIPTQLWQQFAIEQSDTGGMKVTEGYIYSSKLKTPEKLTPEYLSGFDGVDMNDFMFRDKSGIDQLKVSDETLTLIAGTVQTTHYREARNNQTVDFWIADVARPIGLVKLVSKGSKASQNYGMELKQLVKNVKAKIDPSKAKPLSEQGRNLLPPPQTHERQPAADHPLL